MCRTEENTGLHPGAGPSLNNKRTEVRLSRAVAACGVTDRISKHALRQELNMCDLAVELRARGFTGTHRNGEVGEMGPTPVLIRTLEPEHISKVHDGVISCRQLL